MAHCKCRLLILFTAHILPLSGLREAEQFSWGHRPVPTEEVGLTVPSTQTQACAPLKRTCVHRPSNPQHTHACGHPLAIEQEELRASYLESQRGWHQQVLLSGNFGPGSSPCRIFFWGSKRGYVGVHRCPLKGTSVLGKPPREVAI